MVSQEQRSLLLLHQCILDTGAAVMRSYTEPKLTVNYGGSIAKFLDSEKHFFYHQWNAQKKPCCACPPSGCSILKIRNMDQGIFDKMYTFNRTISYPNGHYNKTQNCICRFISNNIDMEIFDLIDLNFLLKSKTLVPQSDEHLVKQIMTIRCKVFHASSSKSFSKQFLTTLWADFESALLQLAEIAESPNYRKMVKLQISTKKETILTDAVVEKLLKDIDSSISNKMEFELMKLEIKQLLEDNMRSIPNRVNGDIQPALDKVREQLTFAEKNTQRCIEQNTSLIKDCQEIIKDHVSKEAQCIKDLQQELATDIANIALEAKRELCENINAKNEHAEECINKNTDLLKNCFRKELQGCQDTIKVHTSNEAWCIKDNQQKLGTEITNVISERNQQVEDCITKSTYLLQNCVKEGVSAMTESQNELEARLYRKYTEYVDKVKAEIIIEVRRNPILVMPCTGSHCVNYGIRIDSEILKDDHAKEVLSTQTISKTEQIDLDQDRIEMNTVETNCLLIEARSSSRIFRSKETFREAILALIRRVLEAGQVDSSIQSTVYVSVNINTPLNEEEIIVIVNLTCETDVEVKHNADEVSSAVLELHDADLKKDKNEVLWNLTNKPDEEMETFALDGFLTEKQGEENIDRLLVKGRISELFQKVDCKIEVEFRRQRNTSYGEKNQLRFEERLIKYDVNITSNFQTGEAHVLFLTVPYTVPDWDMIQLHSANTNSIFLEATSSPSIFKTKETLRAAIRSLIKRVLDAGSVDITAAANVNVALIIITPLTDDDAQVVTEMIGKCYDEVQTAGPKIRYKKEQEDMDSNYTARHMSSEDFMTKKCSKCKELEKAIQRNFEYMMYQEATITEKKDTIRLLEEKISKLDVKRNQNETGPEQNVELLGNKGISVDMFGGKQSSSSSGTNESFNSKGEPYVFHSIRVLVIEETALSKIWANTDLFPYVTGSRLYSEMEQQCERPTHWDIVTQRSKTNTEMEITTDFDRIAKRFAEFQGFNCIQKISWMDLYEGARFRETDMDCLVLLFQQPNMFDWKHIEALEAISYIQSSTTAVVGIMQVENDLLPVSSLFSIVRRQDCILAGFSEQTIGLLGAAMDKMKSSDDFASVLLAVSKEVEDAKMKSHQRRIPSIVISTLTKDLCFQKKDTLFA